MILGNVVCVVMVISGFEGWYVWISAILNREWEENVTCQTYRSKSKETTQESKQTSLRVPSSNLHRRVDSFLVNVPVVY